MLLSFQKSIGTDWTATVAWLSIALVFGPAILITSEPSGQMPAFVLAGSTLVFLSFAALTWHRYSRLTMPSLIESRSWWR